MRQVQEEQCVGIECSPIQRLNLTRQDLLGQSLIDLKTTFARERSVALAGSCKSRVGYLKQHQLDMVING